jgi:hypothetical protein
LPDGISCNQKIWLNFGGPRKAKCWNIVRLFGLFFIRFTYSWPFGNFVVIWYCTQKKSGNPVVDVLHRRRRRRLLRFFELQIVFGVTSSIDRSSDRGGNFEIRSQSYDL